MNGTLNGAAAVKCRAALAFAIIHAEALLEAALRAIHRGVIAKR